MDPKARRFTTRRGISTPAMGETHSFMNMEVLSTRKSCAVIGWISPKWQRPINGIACLPCPPGDRHTLQPAVLSPPKGHEIHCTLCPSPLAPLHHWADLTAFCWPVGLPSPHTGTSSTSSLFCVY